MTTTFTAVLKIKVAHKKGELVDTNSVKAMVAEMMGEGDENRLCLHDGKTERMTDDGVVITLHSLKEGREQIDLDDFLDFRHPFHH